MHEGIFTVFTWHTLPSLHLSFNLDVNHDVYTGTASISCLHYDSSQQLLVGLTNGDTVPPHTVRADESHVIIHDLPVYNENHV